MEIKEMPPLLGLNLKEFSKRYGIPYRTLQGWIGGERECPPYVKELLERVVLEDKAENEKQGMIDQWKELKEAFEKYVNCSEKPNRWVSVSERLPESRWKQKLLESKE